MKNNTLSSIFFEAKTGLRVMQCIEVWQIILSKTYIEGNTAHFCKYDNGLKSAVCKIVATIMLLT